MFCHIREMNSGWLRNSTMVREHGKCKIYTLLHCFMAFISSSYHTKQQNPWPNSSASHVVNYNWLSTCQEDMEPFEGDPNTHGHRTSLRNNPQQKQPGNFQHQYLAELLVNVYNYRWMVKIVPCCYVRGSQLISNSVQYY